MALYFQRWLTTITTYVHQRNITSKLSQRLLFQRTHQHLSFSFEKWSSLRSVRVSLRRLLHRAVTKWKYVNLHQSFHCWSKCIFRLSAAQSMSLASLDFHKAADEFRSMKKNILLENVITAMKYGWKAWKFRAVRRCFLKWNAVQTEEQLNNQLSKYFVHWKQGQKEKESEERQSPENNPKHVLSKIIMIWTMNHEKMVLQLKRKGIALLMRNVVAKVTQAAQSATVAWESVKKENDALKEQQQQMNDALLAQNSNTHMLNNKKQKLLSEHKLYSEQRIQVEKSRQLGALHMMVEFWLRPLREAVHHWKHYTVWSSLYLTANEHGLNNHLHQQNLARTHYTSCLM